jgi:class 3 adenylate cyclase/predicted ATPase
VSDVGDWLRSLGLEQYETAFRDNAIDDSILPRLTAEDLKDLGVSIVGHRRRLLDAIEALRTYVNVKPTSPSDGQAIDRSSNDAAERRQVTVLFSDLVGSTALSQRMDPEDLREIISAYQICVTEIVHRYGGFIARYMGDGVLVYFGYPQAHEDDAERAVRAALELVTAVSALKTRTSLETRVGIATGLVVVGELLASGEAQERGMVGETPNLGARLQAMASPNMVVIAETTRKLIGNLFELQDLGSINIKGISGPVRAWAALRTTSVESRFEALHSNRLTALVGRDEESDLLLRRWSKAKAGEGQVVLISGEPGIGKSRLTMALMERLAAEPHTRLRYFCSPQHADSPLYPIIGQMERAAGLAREDTTQRKLDKLDSVLSQSSTSAQDAALFAEMLSLPNDGRYPALPSDPQQLRRKTMEALVKQVEALALSKPVLMIFEDAHWIDPTSLEVIGLAVQRIAASRVLLIFTYRSEFEAPWTGLPHVTSLTINRLAHRDIEAMIEGVTGNKVMPAGIRQDIIERADGIPLFVEEMTKAVLEAESEGEAQRTTAAIALPTLAVPASLHASLMARLDRLGPAKEVAQIGAAIGREFSHALLALVVNKSEVELDLALNRLITAGLLFRQGVPPHATYLFKHALVQDAAYGTLLREPRRVLHARIAETLQCKFAEIAENQPELLARHCTEAGLIEKAVDLWGKAGQRSLARSALAEATTQFARALDQIATLPGTPALRQLQMELQVGLVNGLMHVKGYAAPETKAAEEQARLLIDQAEALGETPKDPLILFSVLYGAWVKNYVAINGDEIRNIAAQFLALAEKQGAMVPLLVGHRIMGTSLLCTGNVAQSLAHLDQAMGLYNSVKDPPPPTRFGQDVRASILLYRSLALWFSGYPVTALAAINDALAHARAINHAATLMYTLVHTSLARIHFGDYAAARTETDELLALADEKGALLWKSYVALLRGCVLAQAGNAQDAVQKLASGISAYKPTGGTLWLPIWLTHLANAHAELGQFSDAWRCIGEAMTAVEMTKENWWEAEIHRVAGGIALKSPEADAVKAEVYFERALAIARDQGAKSWELRAALDLAQLQYNRGRRADSRDLLSPIYHSFTEGFDTVSLRAAKALLDAM